MQRALLVLAVTAALDPPAPRPEPVATVTFLAGDATRASDGSAEPLALGSHAFEGDVIETRARSRVELELLDGSCVRLGPGTRLVLATAAFGSKPAERRVSLRLALGRLWANVVHALGGDSRFEVATESAVAGVRGTSFSVEATEGGGASVRVYEGTVAVTGGPGSSRWEHLATAEREVRVRGLGAPGDLGRFAPSVRDEWERWNLGRDEARRERARLRGREEPRLRHDRRDGRGRR